MGKTGRKILVVDDDRAVRIMCGFILMRENYNVSYAADGAEALAKIHKEPFDLILLDLNLPFVNGAHVMKLIEKQAAEVPKIILISSMPEEVVAKECREGIAEDYILKPHTSEMLVSKVRKALAV